MLALKLFLVCLFIQIVFCTKNITYRYTVGLLHEKGSLRDIVHSSLKSINSNDFQINFEILHVKRDSPYECVNSVCSFILKYPTVGIFGPTSKSNVDAIESICSARSIPHILTDYVGPLQGFNQFSLYPNIDLLTKAYMDILSSMEWKQFTFLYTSKYELPWGKFVEKAQNSNFDFDVKFLDPHDSEETRHVLEELKKTGSKYFVIDCLEEYAVKLLLLFQHFGMVTKNYHYFFTNIEIDNTNISFFKSSGVDITTIQLFSSNSSDLPSGAEALVFDAVHMFANALKWLKPTQNANVSCQNGSWFPDGESVWNYMNAYSYKGVTGEISFGRDKYRDTFELFINQLKSDGMKEVGIWNKQHGVEYTESLTKEESVTGGGSKPLVVVTSLKQPYVMVKQAVRNLYGSDRYQGFVIDLIYELSKIANFNYTIIINEHNVWELIKDVQMQKADLAILDIPITSERMDFVDFTHPIMKSGINILFRKPFLTPPKFYYFARPFSEDFWLAIGIAFVAVTISLFIVGRLCKSEWQTPNPKSKYSFNQLTFLNTIWFVAGSLFRQNTQVKIRSIPGRTIAATWWLVCFLVIAMYIAALISHKVTYEKHILFSDVYDLVSNANKYGIKYGAVKDGSAMNFFKSSARNPLYQEIYQHMSEHEEDLVSSIEEGVQRTESSLYAFFTDDTTIEYITRRHCQLARYGGLLNEYFYGIALRHNSSYLHSLNTAILKLSTMGTLEMLKKKWWVDRGGDSCDVFEESAEMDEISPLELVHVVGLIQITVIGVTLATISGIFEFIFYTYRKSKKLNIGFCTVFKQELRCFMRNRKATTNPNFITKPVPEDEEHAAATEVIELN